MEPKTTGHLFVFEKNGGSELAKVINWNNSLLPPSVLKSSGTKTVLDIEAVNSVLELVIGRAGNP